MTMPSSPDPRPWYQPLLPLDIFGYQTAADFVMLSFDFTLLRGLKELYEKACRELDRLKFRAALLAKKLGWELPSGVWWSCVR